MVYCCREDWKILVWFGEDWKKFGIVWRGLEKFWYCLERIGIILVWFGEGVRINGIRLCSTVVFLNQTVLFQLCKKQQEDIKKKEDESGGIIIIELL